MALDAQTLEVVMQKTLVIQTAFIGDAILTLPLLQELKRQPGSFVGVVCAPRTEDIFRCSPAADEVLVLDKRGKHKNISALAAFARSLATKGYTCLLAPHRSLRTTLLSALSGIPRTVGFRNASCAMLYKELVPYEHSAHEVRRNLRLLGAPVQEQEWRVLPVLAASAEDVRIVDNVLAEYPAGRYVAVAPGSVWQTKRYPLEHYAEICRGIVSLGYGVLVTGGNEDVAAGEYLVRQAGAVNTCGRFTIPQSVELLRRARLLVTNDSAPAHFGVAAGIPVLTVYCSTIPEFGFYPYSPGSRVIGVDGLGCRPCGIHGYRECPLQHFNCGNGLAPGRVLSLVKDMLADG